VSLLIIRASQKGVGLRFEAVITSTSMAYATTAEDAGGLFSASICLVGSDH